MQTIALAADRLLADQSISSSKAGQVGAVLIRPEPDPAREQRAQALRAPHTSGRRTRG